MEKYLLFALALTISLFQVGRCGVVKQWGKRAAPDGIVISEQHKVFTCSGGDGYYASPGQCTNVYYYCENGLAEAQTCPEGEVFDLVTFVCTTSSQASCNQKFDCPSDGIFPYPDACTNVYYVCSGGQLYVEYCPENFVFDPILLKCVPKESASCWPITTDLPTTVTVEVTTETEAPMTDTEAPTTDTEAPTTDTEAPTTDTEAPTTDTEAPTVEIEASTTILKAPMLKAYKMWMSTEFTCPSDQHGLYATTCTTYYECVDGVPYLRNCPKCTGIRLYETLPMCAYLYDNDPCYSGNTCN
ncbi:chondroitin proteoglycan 1-like [Daphnia carinata]|uniref:chondroitin proteoglycan 1-like n=1 Tax=Daphnia carinata TaxID=120202 RepID=UPI0025805895|nr:chondroitin proteoglycan 1-like [Daphnia carinata]